MYGCASSGDGSSGVPGGIAVPLEELSAVIFCVAMNGEMLGSSAKGSRFSVTRVRTGADAWSSSCRSSSAKASY